MKDYSQNGEQQIIVDYFNHTMGRFLDIGANDGETLSNTRALVLMGWIGVSVEPALAPFRKLHDLYHGPATNPDWKSAQIVINAAITTVDGPIDFWESGTHWNKGDTGLLSTCKESEVAQWSQLPDKFTKTTVLGMTINTMMERCGERNFDFISIDCEGTDYEVLSQINLQEAGCKMLCVETNGRGDDKYVRYAERHGMKLHTKNNHNLIFSL